jgi:hypothetical protein
MRDEKPREKKEAQRHERAPSRVAMYQAHRSESRDMYGNHGEANRQMALRHEKAIADMQEKQEREMTGAPRWRGRGAYVNAEFSFT